MPYTTFVGILNLGINRATTQNIMRNCNGLELTNEELLQVEILPKSIIPLNLVEKERALVKQY